ncbi:uncharacterized protein E5676_scaffold595G00600 [Cucumis melo var. makuwa]|uniref:Uncharacterized protein n=1 Tax=Cucumis melo var. makuwa TaxID=1194695 RepID=A0A5A7VKJ9_CUCMM|nr:uncharacterized protein E6C27_scaffold550G00960 [Cucumis melo var. makuwa]TYK30236.1 uncharacterized protein E5676_scaffold595G00600 [Cucumis melo var. makuwa]
MAKVGYDFTTRTELKSVKIFDERPELSPTQKKLQKQGYSIPNSRAGIGYQSSEPVRITGKGKARVANTCHITVEESKDSEEGKKDRNQRSSVFNRITFSAIRPSVFQRVPSRMKRKMFVSVNTEGSLKVKRHDVVFTRPEDNEPEDEVDVTGCCHVTIEETSDHDIFEEDAEAAPLSLEDGGQSTIDELKEVNLGNTWTRSKGAVHRLTIKPEHRPVKQAQRQFRPELISQIEEEVNKLIEAGFIREVKYLTWIANIVPVRKKNGQLRVCVDFCNLNNACPKDDFLLPVMEIMIDATAGHEALSFMDGSSGYNQIRMALDDEEKTTFRTPKGIYCYKVMPFGLKNVGATYQRAMQRIFDDMLHKHIECYVDDLVVKSKKKCDHLKDLKLVLDRLRKYQLRMNPLKCAFGVTSGKFLGFIVRHRGIEVDHSKIDTIQKMPSRKNLHELRRLQGRLAYIRSIKKYLLNPSVLSAPAAGKPLILYIAAQETSLGALLAQENDKGKECALYYLSRTLTEAELNYSPIEKMCLALFFAIDKLRHYMQAFTIHLVAKADPVKYILSRPFISRRLVKSEAGVSIVFISPEKLMLPYNFTLGELCSNNVVEYQTLIIGLQMTSEFGIKCIEIFDDSKLIINQLSYQYEVKHQDLKPYFIYARRLMDRFNNIILEHIPRSENKKADALANLATTLTVSEDIPINISLCQKWIVPSIESQYEEADVISVYAIDEEDWRQPIINYLEHGKLPTDPQIKLKYVKSCTIYLLQRHTLPTLI